MFDKLLDRVRLKASRGVRERISALADQIKAELPQGIEAKAGAEGIRISGRGVKRRFALDPRLRWLLAGLVK